MPTITSADIKDQKAEVPPRFYESAIIRCLKATFGLSKGKQNPMITLEWELLGIRNKENKEKIDSTITRGGIEYVLAGLSVRSTYHTLTPEAMKYYKANWSKFTGKPESEFSVDTENPDLSIFNKLVMSAVVKAKTVHKTRELSDEEKAAGESNEVKDEDGNPLSYTIVEVDTFNKRFDGEVQPF